MLKTTILLLTTLLCLPALSIDPILSQYHLPMFSASEASMMTIAKTWEIHRRGQSGFDVIIPAHQSSSLLNLAPEAQLIIPDLHADLVERVLSQSGWHDFDSMLSELDQAVKQYPNLTSIEQYGTTQDGYPLKAIRLLSSVGSTSKPALVITGATHGNELITVEVVLGLMDKLLSGYGKDSRITKMVDDHELWFIPVVNADGYNRQERYCDGVDPNRDYPWVEDPQHKPNVAIQSIMDFFKKHQVKASIDYHSAAGMVMYPWGYTYDPIPSADKEKFDKLTKNMAEANGYQYGQIAETIYIATGCSADYYYSEFGTMALGIEISQDGSSELIPSMLEENTESTWRFIEAF